MRNIFEYRKPIHDLDIAVLGTCCRPVDELIILVLVAVGVDISKVIVQLHRSNIIDKSHDMVINVRRELYIIVINVETAQVQHCLLYTSPSPRD